MAKKLHILINTLQQIFGQISVCVFSFPPETLKLVFLTKSEVCEKGKIYVLVAFSVFFFSCGTISRLKFTFK